MYQLANYQMVFHLVCMQGYHIPNYW